MTNLSVILSPELRLEQAFIDAGIENPASVIKLTISGLMNDDDFRYINENMAETLQELDLSQISATVIENRALENCTALTSITIPGSVEVLGEFAFYGCDSLTSINITISATLEHFLPNEDQWDVAYEYHVVTNINVHPDNQIYASENGVLFNKDKTVLLLYPKGREGEYIIPDSVTEIADRAFRQCDSLTLITIPQSVIKIGIEAFSGCTSLASLTIPESVTEIGDKAFRDCDGLTSVVVPESIVTFFHDIFTGCIELYESVQKLEELILTHWKVAGEKIDRRIERLLYTRMMKINEAFTWTYETGARLIHINNELHHCCITMRDKALPHIESLQRLRNGKEPLIHAYNKEVQIHVFIYTPDKDGILREPEEGIERVLIDSMTNCSLIMHISNYEYEDFYVRDALKQLGNFSFWSIPDVLKINRMWAEIPIIHQYIKEV